MKTKVFTVNKNNKIEFTEEELQKLLDEVYYDGYEDGNRLRMITWEPQPVYVPWVGTGTGTGTPVSPFVDKPITTSEPTHKYVDPFVTSTTASTTEVIEINYGGR